MTKKKDSNAKVNNFYANGIFDNKSENTIRNNFYEQNINPNCRFLNQDNVTKKELSSKKSLKIKKESLV